MTVSNLIQNLKYTEVELKRQCRGPARLKLTLAVPGNCAANAKGEKEIITVKNHMRYLQRYAVAEITGKSDFSHF